MEKNLETLKHELVLEDLRLNKLFYELKIVNQLIFKDLIAIKNILLGVNNGN
jgi:hypothetical protein